MVPAAAGRAAPGAGRAPPFAPALNLHLSHAPHSCCYERAHEDGAVHFSTKPLVGFGGAQHGAWRERRVAEHACVACCRLPAAASAASAEYVHTHGTVRPEIRSHLGLPTLNGPIQLSKCTATQPCLRGLGVVTQVRQLMALSCKCFTIYI